MKERAKRRQAEPPTTEPRHYHEQLEALRRRAAILEAAALAAEHLMRTDDLQQSIVGALAHLGQAAGADRVYVFETQTDATGTLLTRQWCEWTAPGPGIEPQTDRLELLKTVLQRWIERLEANQTLHGHARDLPTDEQEILAAQGIQSVVMVPIFVGADRWGFAGFDYCRARRECSPAEIDALKTAAGIIGAARQRWQAEDARRESEEKIRNQAKQLAALHDVSRTIGSTLNVDKVLRLTLEQACELFQAPMGAAYMADLVADIALQRAVVGLSRAEATRTAQLPLETSLVGQVVITGRPLFIGQGLPTESVLTGKDRASPLSDSAQPKPSIGSVDKAEHNATAVAAALVPLVVGEHVLGTLNLFFDHPRSFSDDERTLLTAIGRQVGMALANARLFEEVLAAERESRHRAEQLAALHEIDQAISSSLEPAAVYACIVEQAAGLLNCQVATLFLWDETSQEALGVASFVDLATNPANTPHPDITGQHFDASQNPIVKEILDTRAPLDIADAESDPRIPLDWRQRFDIRALLVLPLLSREQITGFLYLIDQTGPRQWQQGEIILAGQLAAQAAVAIENARLFEAEQKARRTSEALQEAAHIVNASLDLNHVLNLLLEQLARLVPYDSAAVFLHQDEQLNVAAVRGFPNVETVVQLAVPLDGDALLQQTIETGRALVLSDAQQDERFHGWAGTNYVRGWIGVPLLVGTELVGILTIDSRQPGTYDDESARLAQSLADHTAAAIYKARLLDDLQRFNRELRRLDELKDQFIQNVSHELRTPLTLVQGNLALLAEGGLDPATQQQAIHTAASHAETLVQLVEGITTLQDLTVQGLTQQPMNLSQLAETALQLARQKAIRAGIELRADYAPDLPIWPGDFARLSQALYQLLDNAIKFSFGGSSVTLRLHVDPEQHELQIEVEDQGIGVPPDEQKRIFDLFYQANGTTTRRFGGTGLGLAIVHRVVQAHGGRVWVESPIKQDDRGPGPGSRFVIRLPGGAG